MNGSFKRRFWTFTKPLSQLLFLVTLPYWVGVGGISGA